MKNTGKMCHFKTQVFVVTHPTNETIQTSPRKLGVFGYIVILRWPHLENALGLTEITENEQETFVNPRKLKKKFIFPMRLFVCAMFSTDFFLPQTTWGILFLLYQLVLYDTTYIRGRFVIAYVYSREKCCQKRCGN